MYRHIHSSSMKEIGDLLSGKLFNNRVLKQVLELFIKVDWKHNSSYKLDRILRYTGNNFFIRKYLELKIFSINYILVK